MTMTPERNYDYLPNESEALKSVIENLDARIRKLENAAIRHALQALSYATEEFIDGRITVDAMREQLTACQEIK